MHETNHHRWQDDSTNPRTTPHAAHERPRPRDAGTIATSVVIGGCLGFAAARWLTTRAQTRTRTGRTGRLTYTLDGKPVWVASDAPTWDHETDESEDGTRQGGV